MRSAIGLWRILLLCGFLGRSVSGESVVRTADGTVHKGEVSMDPAGWVVKPETGDAIRVPLEQMAEVTFGEPAAPAPSAPSGTNTLAHAPATVGWAPVQVGSGKVGTLADDADGLKMDGGGVGLLGNADSFFFAQQRLDASGQIVARLDAFDGSTNNEAMAGIVLRDNLGESAAYAFVGIRKGSGLCFQYRQIASGMTMRTTNVVLPMPVWLRLARSGGAVVADVSADGREWQNMARGNVNLGQAVRAGMALAAGSPDGVVTARFRNTLVGARGAGYSPGSGYPRLVMRGGSILIGPIESADESVVRLGGGLAGTLVSALNLARIEYAGLPQEMLDRAEGDRRGVLLSDGDFLDGSLRRIATNTVTVSSLLFGFRSFAAGSEAAVVQLGSVEPEDAPYRVALRNGSELRARQIVGGTNSLRVESPLLGSISIRREELRSVRRMGTGR